MTALHTCTLRRLRELLVRREVSPGEVLHAFYERGRAVQEALHPYIRLFTPEESRAAESRQGGEASGEGPLAGLPVALKDNICLRGHGTTCGSRMLKDYRPPYDATVVCRLRAAGALFTGKTNMDEFAMGSSTETSWFGVTRNPYDPQRIPGGSSGGSAVVVATGASPVALGSDTGGSIRQPAALCGVLGFKPTYGRVSRYGLVAFASSLDQIGVFARTAFDAGMVLEVIAGHDDRDATSLPIAAEPFTEAIARCDVTRMKGVRVGLPREYFIEGIQPEVRDAVVDVAHALEDAGAVVTEVSLPNTEYAVAVYYIIAPAEASSNLARYDGVKFGHRSTVQKRKREYGSLVDMYRYTRSEGFGAEVKRRIMLGTYVLSSGYYDAYYGKAQRVRALIAQDFEQVFRQVDVLLTPTTPTTAFGLGEKVNDPLQMYLSDVFTIPCNLAGLPGVSVPVGYDAAGLPIGAQLLAPRGADGLLLEMAHVVQQLRPLCPPSSHPYVVGCAA